MDTNTLPLGDQGPTTLLAKRDQLVIPTINGHHAMVIPTCWGQWMFDGVFYSRTAFLTLATDSAGCVYELDRSTWRSIHGLAGLGVVG